MEECPRCGFDLTGFEGEPYCPECDNELEWEREEDG